MIVKELYSLLNELSPFELQEKWDNSGLLVGNMDDDFENIYICLDLDLDVLNQIPSNSVIITHHPLIFSPLKRVNYDSYATIILRELIKKDIALISMHTNFDKTHLNKYVASEVLGLELEEGEDFICYAKVNKPFDKFAKEMADKLNLKYPKTVKCSDMIKTIGLTTGSGMSLLPYVKADCFLTGDIKYHDAMEAKLRGISLIDIDHYESEKFFSPLLEGLLSKYLKKNQLNDIISVLKNPFN